jgi:hypothetical protein
MTSVTPVHQSAFRPCSERDSLQRISISRDIVEANQCDGLMLRSALIVFIAGWIVWFWIDKPSVGRSGLPAVSESTVVNFQRAFDMLKAGYPEMAYVYIWDAHYLILSLLLGALVAAMIAGVSGYLSRKRHRRQLIVVSRRRRGPDQQAPSDPGDHPDG